MTVRLPGQYRGAEDDVRLVAMRRLVGWDFIPMGGVDIERVDFDKVGSLSVHRFRFEEGYTDTVIVLATGNAIATRYAEDDGLLPGKPQPLESVPEGPVFEVLDQVEKWPLTLPGGAEGASTTDTDCLTRREQDPRRGAGQG